MPGTPSSPTTGTRTKCCDHARNNFEGYTFAMRTLEAWGAMIENDHRAYYTAGGRVWVLDLEPCRWQEAAPARNRRRQEVAAFAAHPAHRRHAGNRRVADLCVARSRLRSFRHRIQHFRERTDCRATRRCAGARLLGLQHERVAVRLRARGPRSRRASRRDHQRHAGRSRREPAIA